MLKRKHSSHPRRPDKRVYRGAKGAQYETTSQDGTNSLEQLHQNAVPNKRKNSDDDSAEPLSKLPKRDEKQQLTEKGDKDVSRNLLPTELSEWVEGTTSANTSKQDLVGTVNETDDSKKAKAAAGELGDTVAETTALMSTSVIVMSDSQNISLALSPDITEDEAGKKKPIVVPKKVLKSSRETFLFNISGVFQKVCNLMFSSPDQKTLPPGTIETLSDGLDDLNKQL